MQTKEERFNQEERSLTNAMDTEAERRYADTHKNFEYLGKVFKPLETIKGTFVNKSSKLWGSSEDKTLSAINKNYSWEDFYKTAKQAGAGKIDVFEMDGEKVIPCNRLMYYGEPTWYTKQMDTEAAARNTRTPGLWHVFADTIQNEEGKIAEVCTQNKICKDHWQANAAFICKAVNSHDELYNATVMLLKICMNQGEQFYNNNIGAINAAMDATKNAE